jgi:hypothetical protein
MITIGRGTPTAQSRQPRASFPSFLASGSWFDMFDGKTDLAEVFPCKALSFQEIVKGRAALRFCSLCFPSRE